MGGGHQIQGLISWRTLSLLCLSMWLSARVEAQYFFSPDNQDEQGPGIRYFGSAKDTNGVPLSNATIVIDSGTLSIVVITDDLGRFRKKVPLQMTPDTVAIKCFKPGYQSLRLEKRPGFGPKPTVQVDCVLRRSAAGH
jgi:hypothetical protein